MLSIRVTCTKGTYIRVLAEDIGRALGCGAYLHGLRRTAVGLFSVDAASSLDQLKTLSVDEPALMSTLGPVDAMVTAIPSCTISGDAITRFCHGQPVALADQKAPGNCNTTSEPDDRVRVYGNDQFLGIARIINNQIAPKRLVVIPSPIDAPTRRINK
jgi:tRNA pseudouridine55 synthase